MIKYVVWLRGNIRIDTYATSKKEALQQTREEFNFKRLPNHTTVIGYPPGYFEDIAKNNRDIGFTNLE